MSLAEAHKSSLEEEEELETHNNKLIADGAEASEIMELGVMKEFFKYENDRSFMLFKQADTEDERVQAHAYANALDNLQQVMKHHITNAKNIISDKGE